MHSPRYVICLGTLDYRYIIYNPRGTTLSTREFLGANQDPKPWGENRFETLRPLTTDDFPPLYLGLAVDDFLSSRDASGQRALGHTRGLSSLGRRTVY